MNNSSSWAEQLQNIGLTEFSDANRKILSSIENLSLIHISELTRPY